MTLHASTVWEIRPTGSQSNGGGFYNRDPGTSVDYSQQDAAQLTLADIATDGAGTGVSSVTGGFTAAMVGNIIHITEGTATAGWYEIVAWTSSNAVTIDRSAGLNKTGVTGVVGGAFTLGGNLDTDFWASKQKVAGNIIYIKAGTYVLQESVSFQNSGTSALPIQVVGYNATRGDSPTGSNRPLINCGASYVVQDLGYNYYILKHI
jgi:hypothetical protein